MRMKILKYLIYPGVLAADTENSVATANTPLSTSQLCFPFGPHFPVGYGEGATTTITSYTLLA